MDLTSADEGVAIGGPSFSNPPLHVPFPGAEGRFMILVVLAFLAPLAIPHGGSGREKVGLLTVKFQSMARQGCVGCLHRYFKTDAMSYTPFLRRRCRTPDRRRGDPTAFIWLCDNLHGIRTRPTSWFLRSHRPSSKGASIAYRQTSPTVGSFSLGRRGQNFPQCDFRYPANI